MRVVCVVNYGGVVSEPTHVELELTPELAVRLLEYRPLIASCRAVDEGLAGIVFDAVGSVRWGNLYGVHPGTDGFWYRYPDTTPPDHPPPEFHNVSEFCTVLDQLIEITPTGVIWVAKAEFRDDRFQLESAELPWLEIEVTSLGSEPPFREANVDDPDKDEDTALFEEPDDVALMDNADR